MFMWCTCVCGAHAFACICGTPVCVVCMSMWCACMWHSCVCVRRTCVCDEPVYVVLMGVVCVPVWYACTSVDMDMEQCQRLTLSASLDQSPPYTLIQVFSLEPRTCGLGLFNEPVCFSFPVLSSKSWDYTWAGKSTKHFGILNSSPHDCMANTLPSGHYHCPWESWHSDSSK